MAFRMLSVGQFPDFRTLADFRKEHLETFHSLFLEVLRMCREAGLVRMGHLSLDGSKYQANASKHKAMSYGRIQEIEPQLAAEVKELLRRAAEVDEAEDAEYGPEQRGDELPEELRRREGRGSVAKPWQAPAGLSGRPLWPRLSGMQSGSSRVNRRRDGDGGGAGACGLQVHQGGP